jgi:hypothetical protein
MSLCDCWDFADTSSCLMVAALGIGAVAGSVLSVCWLLSAKQQRARQRRHVYANPAEEDSEDDDDIYNGPSL